MSVQGKNSLSYKKKSVKESNTPHVGVKTLTFGHEFLNAGETFIPFDSLNLPAAFAQSGLSNPSSQSILAAQLQAFKQNVTVVSSARGIIQKSEYLVKNSGIYFKNIESLANEIFEVEVADVMVSGNRIVDMRKIRVEGELLDSTTDFALGYSVDAYSEEIIVFRDGLQMFRSDNNDDSGATGNYYYLNVDYNGRSSVIRFFEPAVDDEAIMVVSTGGIVDSPNVSTFQQIETLAGQIDNLVPTVAALAGVPESNFQTAPNNVDLQAFGQMVMNLMSVDIPIVTEWETFTPTVQGFGIITANDSRWRRVGDNMELVVRFNAGTVTAVEARVFLPNSETIDVLKNQFATNIAGYYVRNLAEVSIVEYIPLVGGPDFLNIGRRSSSQSPMAPRLATEVATTGQAISFFASIPIQGWETHRKIKDLI